MSDEEPNRIRESIWVTMGYIAPGLVSDEPPDEDSIKEAASAVGGALGGIMALFVLATVIFEGWDCFWGPCCYGPCYGMLITMLTFGLPALFIGCGSGLICCALINRKELRKWGNVSYFFSGFISGAISIGIVCAILIVIFLLYLLIELGS